MLVPPYHTWMSIHRPISYIYPPSLCPHFPLTFCISLQIKAQHVNKCLNNKKKTEGIYCPLYLQKKNYKKRAKTSCCFVLWNKSPERKTLSFHRGLLFLHSYFWESISNASLVLSLKIRRLPVSEHAPVLSQQRLLDHSQCLKMTSPH